MKTPSIEELYMSNLTAEQLKTLLPCYRPDIQKVIEDRIFFLENKSTE